MIKDVIGSSFTITPLVGEFSLEGATTCTVSGEPRDYCRTPSIYYFFRQVAGASNGCEFIKASNGQLAASMAITFPPEPGDLNATKVLFPTPSGGTVSFEPKLCTGTVVGLDGYPTIKEVLDYTLNRALAPPAGYEDQVMATPEADWTCILDEVVSAAPGGHPGGYIQIYQRILFWGDPLVVRY